MAYDPTTGLDAEQQILQDSPTAYNNAAAPTSGDLVADRKRLALEKSIASADNARLQKQWYGTPAAATGSDTGSTNTPILEKALNALTAPLKATVGVAQYARDAISSAPHDSLGQTINKNLAPEGETWGNFLQSVNVPHVVSAPLGFVMDVALDPLHVAMMGTSSFLGKTGYGA
jgi:hypothetical protein